MIIKGRKVVGGQAKGEALVSSDPVGFYGGVDPETGVVTEPGHVLEGESITGKILIFPHGKGSTVGSYVIYRMSKIGTAPAAIVNKETELIIATGCVLANIPLIDRTEEDPIDVFRTGSLIKVNADEGYVQLIS
jgi:predicted aconitase with swiveling domain